MVDGAGISHLCGCMTEANSSGGHMTKECYSFSKRVLQERMLQKASTEVIASLLGSCLGTLLYKVPKETHQLTVSMQGQLSRWNHAGS